MSLTYLLKVILMWVLLSLVASVFSQFLPAWELLPGAVLLGAILVSCRSEL